MLKFIIGLIGLILVLGTLAKIFFPQHARSLGQKDSPVRKLFVQIAAVFLIASALAVGVRWWNNRAPELPPVKAMPGFSFKATDITGATYARDFAAYEVRDHTGQLRSMADYRGKAVLIFFGYTQCPDVCPTAMQRFTEAFRLLGPASSRVQVLFVTLDPARDTQEILASYVPWFDKSYVGLRTSVEQTAALAKEFRVFYAQRKAEGALGYTVDHWAGAYAYDPQGRLRLYIAPDLTAADVANDVKALLQ